MATEATGEKLGRLIGRARNTVTGVGGPAWLDRQRAEVPPEDSPQTDARIDVELVDALARAEAAEKKVAQLTAELLYKEEILTEARRALRTARVALRDHLRLTQP